MAISSEVKVESYEWDGTMWLPVGIDPNSYKLLSCTSFLVTNGTALTLELHLTRLIRQAEYWDYDFPILAWVEALSLIASKGTSWPRVDLSEDKRLFLHIRSAPEIHKTVKVKTWDGEDPRTHYDIKGPDLLTLSIARKELDESGSVEGILCDKDGFICEGFTTGLLWWDNDTLYVPTEKQPKLISTAMQSILGIAIGLKTSVEAVEAKPESLHGKTLWTVNAVHGIRVVENWINGPELVVDLDKAKIWQEMLSAFRQELSRVE